jgi:hypothetical protein
MSKRQVTPVTPGMRAAQPLHPARLLFHSRARLLAWQRTTTPLKRTTSSFRNCWQHPAPRALEPRLAVGRGGVACRSSRQRSWAVNSGSHLLQLEPLQSLRFEGENFTLLEPVATV